MQPEHKQMASYALDIAESVSFTDKQVEKDKENTKRATEEQTEEARDKRELDIVLAMIEQLKKKAIELSPDPKRLKELLYERVARRRIAEPQFETGDEVEERFNDDPHREKHVFVVETHTIGDTRMVWLRVSSWTEIVLTMTMHHAMLCFKRTGKRRPALPVVAIGEEADDLSSGDELMTKPHTQAVDDDDSDNDESEEPANKKQKTA